MSNRNILIVEDTRAKVRAFRECLKSALPDADITATETISVAGQLIETRQWSGIILDLAFHRSNQIFDIPNRPYLAGVEILQQLKEMRLTYPVIIATQHSSFINTKFGTFDSARDLGVVLKKVFPRNFRSIIEVDLSSAGWRDELIETIRAEFL